MLRALGEERGRWDAAFERLYPGDEEETEVFHALLKKMWNVYNDKQATRSERWIAEFSQEQLDEGSPRNRVQTDL